MKQFRFSLESVRHWRESLLKQEEARFQLLAAQRADLAHRLEQLRQSESTQRSLIAHGASTTGTELQRLGEFTAYASKIGRRIESEIARLRHEMETQGAQVAKARQSLELLERLKDKEHRLWRLEFDKELQTTADEAYSAQIAAAVRRKLAAGGRLSTDHPRASAI